MDPQPTTQEEEKGQKITIEVVNKANELEKFPEAERKDPGSEYKYNIEYHRFCDDLGVKTSDREDIKIAQKASLVYDWAKEQIGSDNGAAISSTIKDLIHTLGVQNIKGELLVDHLYRWIRIDMADEQLRTKEKEKELVEKEVQIKQQIKSIEPKISDEELTRRVKAGMKDVQSSIKRKVKSHITLAINKGIREALQKASASA